MIEDCVSLSDDDVTEINVKSAMRNNTKRAQFEDVETIVIDEEATNNNNCSEDKTFYFFLDRIYKENRYFANFVEKCLELENSDGMMRIIKRNLIINYEQSDQNYRFSEEFKKVLLKALNRLEVDPDHKFSHMKDLVETLKLHKRKKRVQLTTLAVNLNGNPTKKRCTNSGKSVVIDLDSEEKECTVINLDDEPNDVIVLDDTENTEEKENKNTQNGSQDFLVPQVEIEWNPSSRTEVNDAESISLVDHEPVVREELLISPNIVKIKQIESHIAALQKKITEYEEAEVDDDSVNSPYVMCERYKAQVVDLYQELCGLTGYKDTRKRRKVRLKVLEGHPAGPVKKLERLINDNIGEDGMPLFPDFCDVVECVMVANLEDKLGWSKNQIMNEASSLFAQCGRALQKRRQRREYRDLLSRVKVERKDYDPADEDPVLQARLEANRRIAIKKETDLLERYTILQYQPKSKEIEPAPSIIQNEEELAPSDSNCIIEDSDEDSNFEPPLPLYENDVTSSKEDEEQIENEEETNKELKIKQEPVDIIKMLEELGDNFTSTVVDIEDPFLVIEIDTSDDEAATDDKND